MKKGFTLIELLAVIVLLGIIGVIVYPIVNTTLNSQKQTAYEQQIDNIKQASERWAFDHTNLLPINDGEFINITANELVSGGYITSELVDPRSGKNLSNLTIKITKKSEGYYYDVIE